MQFPPSSSESRCMPADVFKIRAHTRSVSKDGQFFVLDVNTGKYYGLNRVGAAIWTSLEQGRTRQELVSALLEKFNVAEGKLIVDIEAMLTRLLDLRLVERLARSQVREGSSFGAPGGSGELRDPRRDISK